MRTSLFLVALGLLAGCVNIPDDRIIAIKSTTAGINITKDGQFQFGLVRHYYLSIPVSTNHYLFAPVFTSDVNAGIGFTHQNATEHFSTGSTNYIFQPVPP